ncbi:uncharacterized protein K452DRAFT_283855 [Aplosporella prunicola CBS 121167]|uniref:FAM192A/Fyv6 N-terminal domain-containing protein n=1 Tax=Aplosporella prunicola CBS 121167 TaxID=1176127 RepID=A0A6A6BN02_9PEZI|nr:uncharacterized protein K452DRAFT_283855 [Aplosporella prunicola CBS 121167]KAF2145500.1 hypothetical protein K452DRAFT_283855 [Aplosporella prunicola CBS 121167]
MSRFVSGGTIDQPVERDDEWLKAQQEIEANRRKKEEESRQENGKSLYEVLQENKAKKQEAFEESIRLKNQFRALDEDEVDFLDSVLESTRAKEDAVKKETSEQLDAFRKHQEEVERAARLTEGNDGSPPDEEEQWASAGRKRKKGKEPFKGLKLRKASSTDKPISPENHGPTKAPDDKKNEELAESSKTSKSDPSSNHQAGKEPPSPKPAMETSTAPAKEEAPPNKPKPSSATLRLTGYSSDEDD